MPRSNTLEPSACAVKHRRIDVAGIDTFYREAGAEDAPVLLLPHGYPCSSYAFRNFMPRLADRFRLLAPDFPGCGYSDTPADFSYTFDGYADFLQEFIACLGVRDFALYLHDFGSQIGLRFALRAPERVRALIIQNGDIYEDQLGPKYAALQEHWRNPSSESHEQLVAAVSERGFEDEFLNAVRPELAELIPPDLWRLHWSLMTPARQRIALRVIEGLAQNLGWFPRYQAYLREHQPPTLIVWGPQDGYMPEAAARAYLRDLPRAELHILDGGHWALETNLEQIVALTRDFLQRLPAAGQDAERAGKPAQGLQGAYGSGGSYGVGGAIEEDEPGVDADERRDTVPEISSADQAAPGFSPDVHTRASEVDDASLRSSVRSRSAAKARRLNK